LAELTAGGIVSDIAVLIKTILEPWALFGGWAACLSASTEHIPQNARRPGRPKAGPSVRPAEKSGAKKRLESSGTPAFVRQFFIKEYTANL
jgi:hypothetical protein